MVLLATIKPIDAKRLRNALDLTFDFRATHQLPSSLPEPPASWVTPYSELARSNDLAWKTIEQITSAASAFLNAVLVGNA